MNAASLREVLAGERVALSLEGGALKVEADADVGQALLALIVLAKRELVELLLAERAPAMWNAEDWQAYFNERAGVLEHDCGLARNDAERQALQDCLRHYAGR